MLANLSKWALILLASFSFVIADSLSAHWGKTANRASLIFFLVLSPIGYLFFALLNRRISLGLSSGLVNLFMVLGNVLVGLVVFNEFLTLKQILGILLACLAIILMA